MEADDTYETNGNVFVTVHKAGRVLVNQTLQMTADTKLSLISGNTRADFSPSAAKITVGGAVIEMTASGIKISVGAASVELNPGPGEDRGADRGHQQRRAPGDVMATRCRHGRSSRRRSIVWRSGHVVEFNGVRGSVPLLFARRTRL
ncbi:MAG: hypothetical protein IPN17_08370 [Deltaproteobacteria bacterium]|nr:hypothetical protein [Deltaproteobacteria bacterium]